MRKMIFGALIALLVLLVLPFAASAVDDNSIMVSGDIIDGGSIDVTVTGDVSFGVMTPGNTYTNTNAQLTVDTTYPSWVVKASDPNPSIFSNGRMVSGTDWLSNAFLIKAGTGPFNPLPVNSFVAGTATGITTVPITFQQLVAAGDPPGSYSITIEYTGAAA
jgi:hypothetical protein